MTDKHSTSDILTRLRAMAADKALAIGEAWNGLNDAAYEIERLRAERDALRRRIAESPVFALRIGVFGYAGLDSPTGKPAPFDARMQGKRVALVVVDE